MPPRATRNVGLPRGGLYAISDGQCADLAGACESALRGGAAILQYRDKTDEWLRRHQEASALVA